MLKNNENDSSKRKYRPDAVLVNMLSLLPSVKYIITAYLNYVRLLMYRNFVSRP